MPPILTKKVAGLPTWAWLLLISGGVGVGLYLRSKSNPEESGTEEAGSPVEENAENLPERSPAAITQEEGFGYAEPGVGGPGGYQYPAEPSEPIQPQAPSVGEISSGEQGGVVINQYFGANHRCDKKKKLKPKKGFDVVCTGTKWAYEPKTHAGAKKKHPTHTLTGGGAPKKQHRHGQHHGKARR